MNVLMRSDVLPYPDYTGCEGHPQALSNPEHLTQARPVLTLYQPTTAKKQKSKYKVLTLYQPMTHTCICVMSSHKLIKFIQGLILGVNTLYKLF